MTVRYNEVAKKYQLALSRKEVLDLALFHSNGEPFEIQHEDKKLVEEIAQKIREKHREHHGAMNRAVKQGKFWTTLYALLLAAAVFGLAYRKYIAGSLQLNVWLVSIAFIVLSVYFVTRILHIYTAGGVGRNDLKDTLMLLEFREWLKRFAA